MQILTHNDLEDLANRTLTNFLAPQDGDSATIDNQGLLTKHLGLNVRYELLSEDGSILGLTTFEDMDIEIWTYGIPVYRRYMKGTVLVDKRLLTNAQTGRRRFTLAHWGAHQLLSRLFSRIRSVFCKSTGTNGIAHSHRGVDDWMEWQADTLASALC
jgi:hypothetical protein